MSLPIDRSALILAQSNQVPSNVASSTRNINAITVLYDTLDELNQKVVDHTSASTLAHPDNSVTTAKIANLSVTTPKLADSVVTNAKVANGVLTADKFVQGSLTNDTQNGLRITALETEVMKRNKMSYLMHFPAHLPYRAWQGVTTDGNYIYAVTGDPENLARRNNIISVYSMFGEFVYELLDAYTGVDSSGKKMCFGNASIINGELWVPSYNFNDGGTPPYESKIAVFNLYPTLTFIREINAGSGVMEGVVKYSGYYWCCYHDVMQIKEFDSNFNLVATYPLSGRSMGVDGAYQGLFWYQGDLYCNMHGPNAEGYAFSGGLDRYTFRDTFFSYVETIMPPSYGATQGVCEHDSYFYWNDRIANQIVITPFLKSRLAPIIQKITTAALLAPIYVGDWVDYDANRPVRYWKDQFGVVHFQGMMKLGTINQVAFKLPIGYRPRADINIAAISNDDLCRLNIVGNHTVNTGWEGYVIPKVPTGSAASNAWVALDGVSFIADPEV